jgi:hypothetical protein
MKALIPLRDQSYFKRLRSLPYAEGVLSL